MTNIVYREATGEDKAQCFRLAPLLSRRMTGTAKELHKHLDLDDGIEFLFEKASEDLYVVAEKYLVAYVITPGWCFTGDILVELCILDIYRDEPGTLKDVTDFLEQQAKAYNCIGVHIGTSLHRDDAGMVSELRSLGYSPDSYQHFKGV